MLSAVMTYAAWLRAFHNQVLTVSAGSWRDIRRSRPAGQGIHGLACCGTWLRHRLGVTRSGSGRCFLDSSRSVPASSWLFSHSFFGVPCRWGALVEWPSAREDVADPVGIVWGPAARGNPCGRHEMPVCWAVGGGLLGWCWGVGVLGCSGRWWEWWLVVGAVVVRSFL